MVAKRLTETAEVNYGGLIFICGVTSDEEIYVATRHIEEALGYRNNSLREKIVSKSFKDYAGSSLGKDKITQSYEDVSGINPKVTFYPFSTFLLVTNWEAENLNKKAIRLVISGFADSFERVVHAVFGIKRTEEDRQQWLKQRLKGKNTRRTLTDAIEDYIAAHEITSNKAKWMYANVTELINRGVFARTAKQLKQDWETKNPRDAMTERELDLVGQVEDLTMRLIDQDKLDPVAAAKEALARLIIPTQSR